MLNRPRAFLQCHQSGISLLEVLVTVVIIAFGLLGMAGLQSKTQVAGVESFQRVQAALLAADMGERINANRAHAGYYVTGGTVGTGDGQPADCTALALGSARDICEWSNALKGSGEKAGSSNVGSMQGGRACITQVQALDPTSGVCAPGIYLITVVWQGLHQTSEPASNCGLNLYGTNGYRRAMSLQVSVGLPSC